MPLNTNDGRLELPTGKVDITSMRYHELWLQRWLYQRFFVREGYPVPVVFATPMDAFGMFSRLWRDDANPFAYLLALKDENGTPLYQPYPSPLRYPLLSVTRKNIKYRTYQNFSIHQWRHINYPTISDAGEALEGKEQQGVDLTQCDLGNVTTARMPMAFDYRFQLDHFCMRPDTQAFYIERLLRQFWRTGGTLQTWMTIDYPGWGEQYVRMYLEGDVIDHPAPEETEGKAVEFRTTVNLVIEGFSVDTDFQVKPTLWYYVFNAASPQDLEALNLPVGKVDMRPVAENPVLEDRADELPSAGTCKEEGVIEAYTAAGTQWVYFGDPGVQVVPPDNVFGPNNDPASYPTDAQFHPSAWSYGIASTVAFGTPTIDYGPPVAATNVNGTLAVGPSIDVSWDDNAVGEYSYNVLRQTNGAGGFFGIDSVPADSVAYNDPSVSGGNFYEYVIQTVGGGGTTDSVSSGTIAVP